MYAVSASYLSSVRRYVHNFECCMLPNWHRQAPLSKLLHFPHMLVQGALTSLAVSVNVAIGNSPLHQLCIGLFQPATTV